MRGLQRRLQELLLEYIKGRKEFEGDPDTLEKLRKLLLALGVRSKIRGKKLIIEQG